MIFKILEQDDIFIDSILTWNSGLVFLSAWGRETSLLEFIARMQASDHETGIDKITLVNPPAGANRTAYVPSAKMLEKHTSKIVSPIFGDLVHAFVVDKRTSGFDVATRVALHLHLGNPDIWGMLKKYVHVPLLDEWKDELIERFLDSGLLEFLEDGIGVNGICFKLDENVVEDVVTTFLKAGRAFNRLSA
ncbi:hypothetical protein [Hahella ganghwensis]|uniref:hypothetical protein n=1 Tax=Hahella ganghwensis TaxID=286420 RepID=UPI0003754F0D|nr:hypothetical protein [Hahella ganghwensis]